MGIFDILHIGNSGVTASQLGVQNAGNNIANLNTPGFHRRTVQFQSAVAGGGGQLRPGSGVRATSIERIIDTTLGQRVWRAQSEQSFSESRHAILTQASATFGDLGDTGLSTSLSGLMNSFDALAAAPQDSAARGQVLAAAEQFVSDLNTYASNINTLRSDVDNKVRSEVSHINRLAGDLADLNDRIGQSNPPSPDLIDERQRLLDELAKSVDIRVLEQDNGTVDVSLPAGGSLVVGGRARALTTQNNADGFAEVRDSDGRSVTGHGALGGLLEARDTDLAQTLTDLDQFAFDFATAVNGVHSAGYGLDGGTGRDLFTIGGSAADTARTISVDAAVAADHDLLAAAQDPLLIPGDNRNAAELGALRFSALASGEEPSGALENVFESFGQRIHQVEVSMRSRSLAADNLTKIRDSVSGVNLDEEMMDLMRFRQAYTAAAQVIRTADELMNDLLSIKR